MASRAVLRQRVEMSRKSAAESNGENAKKKMIQNKDYTGELRRYNEFWDSVRAEMKVQKHVLVKQSDISEINHDKGFMTSVEVLKRLREKKLVHPQDPWKVWFDILVGALILFSLIVVPYRIGFQVDTNDLIFASDLVIDFIFLCDVILQFNTAYTDPATEVLIISRTKIAQEYFKFWFWIDSASSIPFDFIANGYTGQTVVSTDENTASGSELHSVRLIRILRLIRLFKIIRMLKLKRLRKQIESLNISPGLISIFFLTFQVSFAAHLIACFWHYLGTTDVTGVPSPGIEYKNVDWYELPSQEQVTWLTVYNFQFSDVLDKYVASLYWVITTMLSIGYGDIAATNNSERIYAVFTMLFGGIVFGALIAQVTRMIQNQNPQLQAFKSKMDEIKAYLGEKSLPQAVNVNALEAYAYYLQKKTSFGEYSILAGLPEEMVRKLVFEVYYREISSINLFREASTYSERCFVVYLVRHIKPQRATKGEYLFRTGDMAQTVLFLMTGLVQLSTSDGVSDVVVGYVAKGGFFGDFELLKKTTRLADYKAIMNCSIFAISNDVFEAASQEYPEAGAKFKSLMERRFKAYQVACKLPSILTKSTQVQADTKSALVRKLSGFKVSQNIGNFLTKLSDVDVIPNKRRSSLSSSPLKSASRLQVWVDGELRLPQSLGSEFNDNLQQDDITYRVMFHQLVPNVTPDELNSPEERNLAGATTQNASVEAGNTALSPDTNIKYSRRSLKAATNQVISNFRSSKVAPSPAKEQPAKKGENGGSDSSSSESDSDVVTRRKEASRNFEMTSKNVEERKSESVESKLPPQREEPRAASPSKGNMKSSKIVTTPVTVESEIIYSEATLDYFWSKRLIHPMGFRKTLWDGFIGILIIYSVMLIPIQIGFTVQYTLNSPSGWLVALDSTIDVLFFLDIILSFHTSYYSDDDDAYVLIPQMVRQHYLRTWFTIDFFSTVPFDQIVQTILDEVNVSSLSSLRLVKIVRLARLLKLARVMKLGKYLARLENTAGISPAAFDLLKLLFEVIFICHIFCCCWYLICEGMTSNSWIDQSDKIYSLSDTSLRYSDLVTKYFTSLYYVFTTLTTVGYGDIVANNTSERFINIFMELVGATVFGFMIATVSSLIGNLNHSDKRVRERLSEVTEYLNEKNCPPLLSNTVIRHYKHKFSHISAFDEAEILDRLPQRIAVEILMHNHAHQIKHIPIFSYIKNTSIVAYIFGLMTPAYYDADQIILHQGEQGNELFFLIRGQAMVVQDKVVYNKSAALKSSSESKDHKKKRSSISSFLKSRLSKKGSKARSTDESSDSDEDKKSVTSDADSESENANDAPVTESPLKRKSSWSSFNFNNETLGTNKKDFASKRNQWDTPSLESERKAVAKLFKMFSATSPSVKKASEIKKAAQPSATEQMQLGIINEGDFFGFESMMDKQNVLSASVVAVRPCSVYSLSKSAIHNIIKDHPTVAVLLKTAIGKCINKLYESLGRNQMIHYRGEFLQSIKSRYRRQVHFLHNVNKLFRESELAPDQAASILGTKSQHMPTSNIKLQSLSNNRLGVSEKALLGKVERILNKNSMFYDSEEDEDVINDNTKDDPSKSLSFRNRLSALFSRRKITPSSKKTHSSDYDEIQNISEQQRLTASEFKMSTKKKFALRRHRSYDDILDASIASESIRAMVRTARTNPFRIPLHVMPHKASEEMQVLTPEETSHRRRLVNLSNASLKLARRQSFPSLNNVYWKEHMVEQGII